MANATNSQTYSTPQAGTPEVQVDRCKLATCRQPYVKKRWWQDYCSPICRRIAWFNRQLKRDRDIRRKRLARKRAKKDG